MRSREEEREERRRYEGDVAYEVWRSGGNSDRINGDRVVDAYYDGYSADTAASRELAAQRPRQEEQYEEQQYPEQEYPEQYPEPEVE
jgi:hypothetical protein